MSRAPVLPIPNTPDTVLDASTITILKADSLLIELLKGRLRPAILNTTTKTLLIIGNSDAGKAASMQPSTESTNQRHLL